MWILCSNLQSLLAKQPAVTAGRPVVSAPCVLSLEFLVWEDNVKSPSRLHVCEINCCLQDTSSRAPTGSPRTSNRSAAANVANTMPQSGRFQQHTPTHGQCQDSVCVCVFYKSVPCLLQVRPVRVCWPTSLTVYWQRRRGQGGPGRQAVVTTLQEPYASQVRTLTHTCIIMYVVTVICLCRVEPEQHICDRLLLF